MRVIAVSTFVFAALASGRAHADWQYAKWGMTPEQLVKASGGAAKLVAPGERAQAAGRELGAEGELKDGELRLRVGFAFQQKTHRLACVFYTVLDKRQNKMLRDWLVARYGPGTGNEIAGFMETRHWSKPDSIDFQSGAAFEATVQQCRPG